MRRGVSLMTSSRMVRAPYGLIDKADRLKLLVGTHRTKSFEALLGTMPRIVDIQSVKLKNKRRRIKIVGEYEFEI